MSRELLAQRTRQILHVLRSRVLFKQRSHLFPLENEPSDVHRCTRLFAFERVASGTPFY